MQRMIVSMSLGGMEEMVNRYLRRGWKVVPGTMGGIDRRIVTPNGKIDHEASYWVAIEQAEEAQ